MYFDQFCQSFLPKLTPRNFLDLNKQDTFLCFISMENQHTKTIAFGISPIFFRKKLEVVSKENEVVQYFLSGEPISEVRADEILVCLEGLLKIEVTPSHALVKELIDLCNRSLHKTYSPVEPAVTIFDRILYGLKEHKYPLIETMLLLDRLEYPELWVGHYISNEENIEKICFGFMGQRDTSGTIVKHFDPDGKKPPSFDILDDDGHVLTDVSDHILGTVLDLFEIALLHDRVKPTDIAFKMLNDATRHALALTADSAIAEPLIVQNTVSVGEGEVAAAPTLETRGVLLNKPYTFLTNQSRQDNTGNEFTFPTGPMATHTANVRPSFLPKTEVEIKEQAKFVEDIKEYHRLYFKCRNRLEQVANEKALEWLDAKYTSLILSFKDSSLSTDSLDVQVADLTAYEHLVSLI